MQRVNFTQYKGKKILIEDFSGLTPGEEFLQTMQKAQDIIASNPEKSVLAVFDATQARFNNEMLTGMKNFTKANLPYIKASAVVGIEGLLNVALTSISKFSGREFKSFKTREEAMDWLISQ